MAETEHQVTELEQLFNESIRDEVAFLQRYSHLPVEQQRYYLAENEEGFLHEFIGGVKIKKLTYALHQDGLYFAGIRVMDSYRYAAEKAQFGSRTWHETEGMQHVQDALLTPRTDEFPNGVRAATIFSPPKDADYGFAFHFQKGGYNDVFQDETVETYIIDYPEEKGTLSKTDEAARTLAGDEEINQSFHTTEDYLQTPFLFDATEHQNALPKILSALGVDDKSIAYSRRFQEEIKHSLGNWIAEYTQGMHYLANDETLSLYDKKLLTEEIKRAKRRIWEKASDIKKRVRAEVYEDIPYEYGHSPREFLSETGDQYADYAEREYYETRTPTVHVRRSDCRSVTSDDILTVTTNKVANALSSGGTLGGVVSPDSIPESREPFRCPRCHFTTTEPVGDQCPRHKGGCGLTKKEFIEMSRKKGVKVCG